MADAFLTVEEAAERLGVSRLRVREAAARGQLATRRDNEGRLRVDLPDGQRLVARGARDLDEGAIVGFLFDDIEDLEAALAERDARLARLGELLARQDAALDRAGAAMDAQAADKDRLADLLARALAHLERGDDGKADRLAGLLERALEAADAGTAAKGVADRAMAMLDGALSEAERARADAAEARAAAEAAQAMVAAQGAALERALAAAERAAALAPAPEAPRRGIRRLFGGR